MDSHHVPCNSKKAQGGSESSPNLSQRLHYKSVCEDRLYHLVRSDPCEPLRVLQTIRQPNLDLAGGNGGKNDDG